MKRGEIWWAELPPPWGRRPVLLLSRDEAYDYLNSVIAAPLTASARAVPSQVALTPGEDDIPRFSSVNVDNMQSVPRDALDERITTLKPDRLAQVEAAIHFALALRH